MYSMTALPRSLCEGMVERRHCRCATTSSAMEAADGSRTRPRRAAASHSACSPDVRMLLKVDTWGPGREGEGAEEQRGMGRRG